MIKEKDWKFASYNAPVEVHIELLKLCYEAKLWDQFNELLDPALVRLKFRRYEIPYLAPSMSKCLLLRFQTSLMGSKDWPKI